MVVSSCAECTTTSGSTVETACITNITPWGAALHSWLCVRVNDGACETDLLARFHASRSNVFGLSNVYNSTYCILQHILHRIPSRYPAFRHQNYFLINIRGPFGQVRKRKAYDCLCQIILLVVMNNRIDKIISYISGSTAKFRLEFCLHWQIWRERNDMRFPE